MSEQINIIKGTEHPEEFDHSKRDELSVILNKLVWNWTHNKSTTGRGSAMNEAISELKEILAKAKREEGERIMTLIQGFTANAAAQRYKEDLLIYVFGQGEEKC